MLPDILEKDYQNASGEFDLEKLIAGLKAQVRPFRVLPRRRTVLPNVCSKLSIP